MSKGIVLLESYISGGSDTVGRILYSRLNFSEVHLFVNKRCPSQTLGLDDIPDHVTLHRYALLTPVEISLYAKSLKNRLLGKLILGFSHAVRYPLIVLSILYFKSRFRKLGADVFVSVNGGYPGGEYNRSSTVAAIKLKTMRCFQVFFNKPAPFRPLVGGLERRYDAFLDAHTQFICDAEANGELLVSERNFTRMVKVVHNGLPPRDQKSYPETRETFELFCLANLEDRKNQLMLLEVVAELVERGRSEVRLKLVGAEVEPGYQARVENRITELGVGKYVDLCSFTSEIEALYRNCDLFVLASKGESFPIVTIEALGYGVPVVVTNVGGLAEQIDDGQTGFLVESGNASVMADKLEFFMDDRNRLQQFGNRAYAVFKERFSIDTMVDAYNKILGID